MTNDEIIEIAKKQFTRVEFDSGYEYECYEFTPYELVAFAKLVAEKEREAILDLVDGLAKNNTDLADAIRERGQE